MADTQDTSAEKAMAAVLDWWREAGVDYAYADDPESFLADAEEAGESEEALSRSPPKPMEAQPDRPAGSQLPQPEQWPTTVEAFRDWWMNEPALIDGTGGRIPPRGPQGAALMVLVSQPEREDRDTLLTGPDGALLDAFLRATGLEEAQVYRAALLPRHELATDWYAHTHLAAVTWRHVALVAPERLLILGNNVRSILQNDPAQRAYGLRGIQHDSSGLPVLAGMGLAAMRKAPRTKARLWRDWLDWTGT